MTNVSTRPLVLGLTAWLGAACGASPEAEETSPSTAEMSSNSGGLPGVPGGSPPASGAPQVNSGLGGAAGGEGEASPSPSAVPLVPDAVPGDSAAGAGSAAPLEGDIRFSVPSGAFEGSLEVSLETPIEGALIRFTLDGSEPTLASPVYDDNALGIDQTRQVRAQAFVGDMPAGRPGTALYVARSFDATSDLPLIVLEGYGAGKPVDRDVYVDMALLVFEPVDGVAALSSVPTLATRGGYHLRGQSSAMFEQAPYRIELWDNASEDVDLPLLGMPADSDWALIGPYSDRSLVRNAFVYDLGRDMGLAAPRYAFAEVYINQEARALEAGDYQGIYMLVETIKNNKARLDLAQLEPDDVGSEAITGGYIFKFEWAASEEPTLECTGSMPLGGGGFGFPGGPGGGGGGGGTCWTDLEVVDPEPLAPEQAEFLTDYIQRFHDSLHSEPFAAYSQYIDVPSFVDLFIISELSRNLDAYTRSAYYYKERGGPITAGPLWDYNLTLGMGFGTNLEVVGWQFEQREVASDWFRLLGTDPEFLERVSARWRELRTTLLSEAALDARLDVLVAPLASAAVRDFERWPVAELAEELFQIPSEPTWEGQLDVMREWTRERLDWLDSQLLAD